MKPTLSIILFFLSATFNFVNAQNERGSIEGKVILSQNEPAIAATVQLKGKNTAVLTDEQGNFKIQYIYTGDYDVQVSLTGYEAAVIHVKVEAGKVSMVTTNLSLSEKQLTEVVVSAGRYKETIDEVPSSVSVIGLKAIEKNIQISTNLGDILANKVPGLAPVNGLSSNWGQTLRGRSMLVMIDGVPQSTPLRNGAMDLRALDPAVIERIEVVKGATAIYGNGAAGGLINYFTRSPQPGKIINSQTSLSTSGSLVASANSMGGRVSQLFYGGKNKWSYVLSGVYEQTGEYKDADGDVLPPVYGLGETDSYNAFAKVAYQFNANHKVQFSYNYYSSRQKTNYVIADGDYAKGIKTTAALGDTINVPQGVRGNHNVGVAFSGNTGFINTHYDVDVYYQNVDNVFFYSKAFLGGGISRILSKKHGVRFVFNTPFHIQSTEANISYGIDFQTDKTSQPLVDGRIWVPEMKMQNAAPFAQAKFNLTRSLILKGGVRYEAANIKVADYATLPTVNAQTGAVTNSINVKGGVLKYNTFVFNAGLRYNLSDWFSPYVSFSQGFSVSDIGVLLRGAKVNDIAKINTDAIVVDNFEVGFVTKYKGIRFEATGYISKSRLAVNYVYNNGVYDVLRSPEKICGLELAAEAKINSHIQAGLSYTFVEGKTDIDSNGRYKDAADEYLGGQRIGAPGLAGFVDYAILPEKLNLSLQYNGVLKRDRFAKDSLGLYAPYKGPVRPYNLINLLINYKLSSSTSLSLGVENMFNENYYTARSQWGTWDDSYTKGKGAAYRITMNIKL